MGPGVAGENPHDKYSEVNAESGTQKRKSPYRQFVRNTTRNVPTSFSLKTEDEIGRIMSSTSESRQNRTFGVQSLESAITIADEEDKGKRTNECSGGEVQQNTMEQAPTQSTTELDSPVVSSDVSPAFQPFHRTSATSLSMPLTPLNLRSPNTPGTSSREPSTPRSGSQRSFRLSDEEESNVDDAASQAIASSGEDEEGLGMAQNSEEAPLLVMPSITMPSRRPFTDRGKSLGKLKVLVAGPKGKLIPVT